MNECPACRRLERVRRGDDPFLVAELRESVVLLHRHQRYEGWCSLWLKDHHEHLGLLPIERQRGLAEDVVQVAGAMHRAFDVPGPGARPIRINYECLGNVVPHVHWHLIPRRASDPDPGATVWVRPAEETDCGCDDATRSRLLAALRGAGL
ncbi:MAG: HIT family protein [Phycisphaerales bacterium]